MATCPNKNLDSWKNLVATRGENAAYVLWDTYEGDFPEEDYKKSFSQKISDSKYNKLIKFLDTLRITTEFNADEILDNLNFKNSPLAAFDILQRYLAFRKGAEDLLPEQVANVAYSFLGKKSKLGKDLWININKWSEYQKYYDQFTKEKYVSDEGFVYEDDMDLGKPSFDSFAHKRVIVKFLELGLLGELGERSTSKSRLNVDIDAEYFKSRGRKNPYEGTALEKLWARFYNYMQDLFGKKIFEEYDDKKLRDLALDIVDDIYKEDYKKFIRGIYESDGKLYKSDGKELEVKYYEETLEKDLGAKKIIQSLVRNPYIGFKLSGSQTLRKYGKLYRPLEEDLHDIDGVIPLDTFRKDPNSFAFKDWIQNVGLRLSPKQFFKEVEPRLENLNWFVNLKAEYPNFKMTNAFIGKDHARGESVTITGYIEDPTQKVINPKTKKEENKKYVLDFFLRTDEGNYPEIFDNYWKDWKQIFEAKLNMGRSKDLADLIYFDPFLEDKFKFTNKGFRYFSFPEGVKEKSTIEETPSEASPELISKVEELFNSTPELANQVYEALGFKSNISIPDYEVVTRPTKDIGKSKGRSGNFVEITTPNNYRTNMSSYMVQPNDDGKLFITNIEKYNEDSTFKGFGTVAYIDFFENYKNQGITTDTKLTQDGIKVLERLKKIGLVYKTNAKLIDDTQTSKVFNSKIYEYDKPLYEFNLNWTKNQITPQQKQQALQQYSQYLILGNKQDIEGFREFVQGKQIEETPIVQMFQLEGETESSRASNQTIALIKDFLSRIGVDIKNVDEIVVNGVKMDANAAALIAQKLVLLTEGKEGIALTEEAMHFAVEIIEQKDPKLFNQLLKEINSYRLLTTVINDYGKLPMYQTSDGKPDIRKLKKEAIAKVLTEVIINKNEGITEKPELLAKVETWWQRIINALKGLFSTSGFDRAAMMVLKGEAIGTVDDIRLRNDVFLQENITPQQRIVNQFRMVSASIKKPVNEGDKYEINGKKIRTRVTDISKTWLDNLFAERKLTEDEFDKAVNNIYSQSGSGLHNDIHKMLVGTLLDDDGKFIKDPTQRKSDDNYVSQLSPLNKKFYDLLKEHMEKRLATFPDNTTFLSEITIYDPKRDLAGTVDFIAVEPSGKTHILDWKFIKINNVEYQEDIPWYSVGYWRRQMKNYKLILSNAYGIDFDGTEQTRMIPFRAIYSKMDKKKGIKPQLLDLEVGSVDPKIEERAYLVPVGLEEERTGEKRIDALIDQLNQVYDLISERKVTAETKKEKAEQLNELYKAIRQLKMRSNLSPLINQAGVLNKAVEGLITEYYNNWEGKDISEFSQAERNDFASRINDFENSLFVYTNLYKNLRPLFQGELSEKDKKIKDELRDVTEDANELQISLEEVRNKLAEKIASSANIIDYLRPEKVIKGFSSWFGTTSTLQNKSAQILYKMANRAFGLAAMETQSEGSILIDIKKRYDQWAKSKGLTNKNYFDIIKKKPGDNKEAIEQKRKDALKNLLDQKDFYTDEEYKAQERKVHEKYDKELKGKNELIDEYDYKFYSELRKKSQDKDFEWIKENIDVEAYKKHIAEKRETEIERAKNKVRYGSDFARQRQLNEDISKIESLYDVASSEGLGWLLYDETRKFPKEKWISEQWKELYKKDGAGNYVNAPAVELFEYIRSRNDFFEEIGYINPKQERTFLPFVRKGLVEKLVMGGDVTLFEGALRSITVTEGDVGYGQIDPITKKPVYTIPRYFTRDTGEEMSDDLFKNMTIVNEAAIRYRYLTEMEKQMHLIINTESNKNAIKTSYFGKTKLNADGEPEITNDNTENTQLVRDMMEAIVYGHKFVESQNFDQLLFGLGKMGKKFNEKLGMKIFPEEFDDSKISLNKSINWLNNAFQLKALGLNPLSALATLLGGSFQSTINAGKYFTKSEFAKNQFLLASRMNGVDAKKYMGALEYFLPLTENYNMIIAKKLSLSKFSQEGVQDALMYLMRKADQYIQSVNFFSYLDNTIVMDGKLVNAREYLRTTPEYANIYSVSGDERKRMNDKFEEDVKKLLSEKGVMNVAVLEGDKFTIPGVERKSDTVISLRKVVQGITKDALGNLSEDDIRRINLNIYGKSFMVFKNWIPRLVDVRFGNLKYNSATDAYEWGRTRMLMRWLSEEKLRALDSLKSAMLGNDEKFVAQMRALYERKKMDYEKDTGKKLNMTEAEFIELAAQNVKNQMVDVLFYLALTGLVMAASGLKDDDDERAVKNRYNYMIRAIDKIRDEIAYFYNPTQLINLSKSGFFPAISMIENYEKTFRNFIKEMYAISVDDDKMAEKNYVIKYALKGLPVTSQFDAIFLIFFPDLAKDLGMRSQSESRPIGR